MNELDLLFTEKDRTNVNPQFFSDMGLPCLKKLLNNNEYSVFADTLCKPLTDANLITERQNILKDFVMYPDLLLKFQRICSEAQNNKFTIHESVVSSSSSKRKLIENLSVTNKSLEVPAELYNAMKYKSFSSRTLFDFFSELSRTGMLDNIKHKINEMAGWLLNDRVSFDIQYGPSFKIKSAYAASEGYRSIPQKTHRGSKNKILPDPNEFEYYLNYLLDLQIGDLLNRGVVNMCSIISSINSYILNFTKKLSMQLLFYTAAIKIMNYGDQISCSAVFPRLNSDKIKAKALYDLGLLMTDGTVKGKVPNDFSEEDGFYIISGVNQGGKTTFLKSIGIAQLFAQNGLPVFADEYDCPVFKNLVSHFPKDEEEALMYGKLAEELERFHGSLSLMKENALVLLNESFATTTEKEGCEIAKDVLRALSKVRPSLLFVTHNYRLLQNMKEISQTLENGTRLHSLVVCAGNSSTDRTYKINKGEPQKEIHGLEYVLNNIKG